MTSLPFPSFVNQTPVDASDNRTALSAAGRCRFAPSTIGKNHHHFVEEFQAICAKNKEQALVDTETTPETKDENKKLKKKYMKQGVAMASKYLRETLQLDVSIVLVEIVVDSKDIIETDGCLAACLLDAGCAAVVIDGTDTTAMDAAKIPRERIVAHFANDAAATTEAVAAALPLAGTISVQLSKNDVEIVDRILPLVPEKSDKVSFQLAPGLAQEDLESTVSQVSKKCKDGKGSIALVDPSATELGLSFAACMRTDRDDGLFTTVVCTRNGEALGLVYSSKVRYQYFYSVFGLRSMHFNRSFLICESAGINCRCC
jgi:hypothetical protein